MILPALAVALAASASPIAVELGGWIVPWEAKGGVERATASPGALDDVFLFAARLDDSGAPILIPVVPGWPEIAERARQAGARVWLTVVNDRVAPGGKTVLKDAEIVHAILGDPERRREHIRAVVALARQLGAHGIDVDYESLPASERDRFTAFVRELDAAARGAGLALSVTVQPKTGPSSSKGPGAMDWPELCRIADRVQPMLYNEHNAATGPGPVASPGFVGRVVDYALSVCAASRLAPVLKVSGMDWGPSGASWVRFDQARERVARFDPRVRRERGSRVPWFVYEDGGARHVVYFEDAKSLTAKRDAIVRRGISRVVYWSLGSEDPATLSRPQKR